MLFPDFARPLMSGVNVKTPIALTGGKVYRLTLYPELGRDDRSVLVVGMTLQFQFEAADNGLKWFLSEQKKFVEGAVAAIKSVWDDKWRITTSSTAPHRRPHETAGRCPRIRSHAGPQRRVRHQTGFPRQAAPHAQPELAQR
jgi:hypothetical protein